MLFDPPLLVSHSVNRRKYSLFVFHTDEKDEAITRFDETGDGSMIIYCATKKEVERLYQLYRKIICCGLLSRRIRCFTTPATPVTIQSK